MGSYRGNVLKIEADSWTGCYEGGWQGVIVPEAFSHPAKFSYRLTERMFGHAIAKGWLKPGDVVADPFGGVGCGGIVAAYSDIQWVGCELEQKFVDLAKENFELHRRKWERLKSPQPTIIQGDSRKLASLIGQVECVVSSPPYVESMESGPGGIDWGKANRPDRERESKRRNSVISENSPTAYGQTPGQLGAMKPGTVDAVVGSPPFQGSGTDGKGEHCLKTNRNRQVIGKGGVAAVNQQPTTEIAYGETPGNLGNLKEGSIDAVVSSPPYEGSLDAGGKVGESVKRARAGRTQVDTQYGGYGEPTIGQLGREHGPTFWQAAREIVEQCHKILRPGGHAIWVVKAFVRKGKRVDFPGEWRWLCEDVGFTTVCEHHAMLVKEETHEGLFGEISESKESKSFFRRLSETKAAWKKYWETVPTDHERAVWRFKASLMSRHWSEPPTICSALGMCFEVSGEDERDWNAHVRIDYEVVLCMERGIACT